MDVARLMVDILKIMSFYPEEKEGIRHNKDEESKLQTLVNRSVTELSASIKGRQFHL
jgi:hypothetical protein